MSKASRNRKAVQRHDDANAFIREIPLSPALRDDLAELMAEEFLEQATSGESVELDPRDKVVPEELGGPFTEIPTVKEFGTSVNVTESYQLERKPLSPHAVEQFKVKPPQP